LTTSKPTARTASGNPLAQQHQTFAAGGGRQRQVSQGATVAQWYGVDHIIINPDGTLAEHNSYRYRRQPGPTRQAHPSRPR